MKIADPQQRQVIATVAQAALDRHQPRAYRITVNRDVIYLNDDWYHVLVETPDDVRDREFYFALSDAEDELQEEQGHPYLLVPAIAG